MAAIAAVGMFDGVHCGHRTILDTLVHTAAATGSSPIVFTFAIHPLETLKRMPVPLITGIEQKIELLSAGRDICVEILDFTKDDFAASAADFMTRIKTLYGVEAIVMGYNNHIGSDRRDGAWIEANLHIPVTVVPPFCSEGTTPSSSAIRKAIAEADIEQAQRMLGHKLSIRGKVVAGNRVGHTIGFPTANIELLEPRQILPPDGAYAVDVHIGRDIMRGMANIGTRPTLDDGRGRTIEVNIFDFDGDIYGRTLDIDFLTFMRPEYKFDSLEALKLQLDRDRIQAKSYLIK